MALDAKTVAVGQELPALDEGRRSPRTMLKAYGARRRRPEPDAHRRGVREERRLSRASSRTACCRWATSASSWCSAGGVGNVRKFRARFAKLTWPGDVITCKGTVTAVRDEGGDAPRRLRHLDREPDRRAQGRRQRHARAARADRARPRAAPRPLRDRRHRPLALRQGAGHERDGLLPRGRRSAPSTTAASRATTIDGVLVPHAGADGRAARLGVARGGVPRHHADVLLDDGHGRRHARSA